MKNWDLSILIPIFNKKSLVSVRANYRPLRLIFILRKVFEMLTTVRLVEEKPEELEQYDFIT